MPEPLLLRDCRRYDAPADAERVDLLVENGALARIAPAGTLPAPARTLDAGGRTVLPGLIDMHIHGAGGADTMEGTPESMRTMSAALARRGITAFLGTTLMRPAEGSRHLPGLAEAVGAELGGARLLGLYIEGPFVNPEKRGGIPREAIYPAAPGALEEILRLTAGRLRVMTVAPELPGHLEIIERLAGAGVIPAFGHSAATYDETRAGLRAGIRHVTHLFNAMPGLHHRDPGPLAALHEAEAVPVELISDDVHVDRRVVRLAERLFGAERCVLITDAMRALGMPEGRYEYGGRDFESRGGAARYLDGTLIGSAVSLLEVARRFAAFTGCGFATAVDCASRNPARALGIADRKGALDAGKDADLVILDADGEVWATLVEGRVVYRRGEA